MLLARGDDLNIKGNFDSAIADYDAALNLDPVLVEALNGRGQAWHGKGDRRRALTDFDAALKLQPDFEPARANRKSLALEIERLGAQMPLKVRQH
jgi:tetratricopeptide (TPR) repeat protein